MREEPTVFDIEALTRWAEQLGPLPPTAARLAALGSGQSAAHLFVDAVTLDPMLTARVLRIATATMGRSFASIPEVLVASGVDGVIGVALGDSQRAVRQPPPRRFSPASELWRHSVATAVGARALCAAAGLEALGDQAFAAGMLHDLGRVAAEGFFNRADLRALDRAELYAGLRRRGAEELLYGFDHAAIGAQIVERWGLPASLAAALRDHHSSGPSGSQLADVVCLANAMAHWLDSDPGRGLYEEESAAMRRLGIEMAAFETCFMHATRTVVQVLIAYGIDPTQPRPGTHYKPAPMALA